MSVRQCSGGCGKPCEACLNADMNRSLDVGDLVVIGAIIATTRITTRSGAAFGHLCERHAEIFQNAMTGLIAKLDEIYGTDADKPSVPSPHNIH